MARLGPRGHRDPRSAAVYCRHLYRTAEGCRRNRDWDTAEDVRAVALEDPMRRHGNKNIEIAGGGATDTSLALAGEPDTSTILDPRRDVDRQRFFTTCPALATARLAGMLDDASSSLAGCASLFDRKEALLSPHPPSALAGWAGDRP